MFRLGEAGRKSGGRWMEEGCTAMCSRMSRRGSAIGIPVDWIVLFCLFHLFGFQKVGTSCF